MVLEPLAVAAPLGVAPVQLLVEAGRVVVVNQVAKLVKDHGIGDHRWQHYQPPVEADSTVFETTAPATFVCPDCDGARPESMCRRVPVQPFRKSGFRLQSKPSRYKSSCARMAVFTGALER